MSNILKTEKKEQNNSKNNHFDYTKLIAEDNNSGNWIVIGIVALMVITILWLLHF